MPSTPLRITPETAPGGAPSEDLARDLASAIAGGAADTEPPPPGPVAATPWSQPPSGAHVEPTKIGPPPDPGTLGPASPKRSVPPPPMPNRARGVLASAPQVGGVPPPTVPGAAPASPAPPPAQPTSVVAPRPQQAGGHEKRRAATSVGVAPPAAAGPLTRRCTACGGLYPNDFMVCPRDATPLVSDDADAPDPLLGSMIGETYQIVRVVGEGGMGRVYEARHLRLKERRFAVKCLHADLARNAEMAARFLREAESASSIKHHNVVDVFDVHHLADGTPYMVGEFLEGEELADYVAKRGPLEPRSAAKVARQVCSALAAAHARGIVHRDMKPENIFVLGSSIAAVERGESRSLTVKVLDFGISKAGDGDKSHLTRTGVIMGTPSYMAPEQARGRPVDLRADVYSLGACIYFMVTGRRPFDSDDPTSTLSMVLTEDPVRPREIDPRIPESLELVIQRAMAKDALERYASMEELERALSGFLGQAGMVLASGHAMVAAPPSEPQIPVSGNAGGALEVARAMLGTESSPPPSQAAGNLARTARPMIVLTSGALGAWFIGGTVAALAGLVRVLHDGEITLTESLLLVIGCCVAAATPVGLYVMHVKKIVWPNSVRALQLATDLKRTTVSALVTYGGLAILGRIFHTVLFRSSRGLASGVWDIVLFLLSLVAALTIGGFAPLVRNMRRRRQD